ncbi:MAG: preprotein translocase subunit Sec61beta [Candidatus ainarchaeum sp.]|nr:preprotein translocase subunit Sec61beta [Candidatus ainarchaeum sp.]MDD3086052.1 preprotein translocase subunit Sec61beta [Candidatus ainarchaeum sp.]MDD4128704.1 preprotein translocase subunit Sec61beta [Candidatus ainarchaeum sp.]MDD4467942.1 preprotein translocase subunit Sec61beta [Candidatus ainarchaeum sp.]HPM86065.1 preprotein translocase subunit Sec61beta [archaeon]
MVKFFKSKPSEAGSGPSSAIGITRFFDASSKSPQLNPYLIIGLTIAFIIFILLLKMFVFNY